MPITPGLPVMFYSRGNNIDAIIKKINSTLDKNGALLRSKPKVNSCQFSMAILSSFLNFPQIFYLDMYIDQHGNIMTLIQPMQKSDPLRKMLIINYFRCAEISRN